MTETPEDANLLQFMKVSAFETLIRYLNGLTTNMMGRYPESEVQSWPYLKAEAEAILDAGENATVEMAPFLAGVCTYHHGEAATTELKMEQIVTKAQVVYGNALAWASVAQFVNGLRARTQDSIDAATSALEVNNALDEARSQIEAFRTAAGL